MDNEFSINFKLKTDRKINDDKPYLIYDNSFLIDSQKLIKWRVDGKFHTAVIANILGKCTLSMRKDKDREIMTAKEPK
jgi:hypothetical protein